MMLKTMFAGPDKVKDKNPPSTAGAQIQTAETRAKQQAMLAMGRQSTYITRGSNLGNIG